MSDEEQEQTIAEDLVVTKYKMGGDIANRKLLEFSRFNLGGTSCPFRPVLQANEGFLSTAAAPTAAMWFLRSRNTYAIPTGAAPPVLAD